MMSGEKIEGTLVLDGLLQGRLPLDDDQISAKLRQWVEFVAKLGLHFNLEIRDAAFNLLPENTAVSAKPLGDPPEHALEQAIAQLADLFIGHERAQLFSTLRSSEFRSDEEVQTVYTIVDGKAQSQSRSVAANTTPAVEPLSVKEQIKLGLIGGVFVLALLGIALLFPGVRAMFGQVADIVKPLDANEIKVDLGPYAPYFTCTVDEKQSDRSALVLKLKRTDKFPRNNQTVDAAATEEHSVTGRLALENLARGYIRIELFDPDDKFLATGDLRVGDLRKHETLETKLPLPEKARTVKIVFAL
jgi:hypothetical protein